MSKHTVIALPMPPLCSPHPQNAVYTGDRIVANLHTGDKLVGTLEHFDQDKGNITLLTDQGESHDVTLRNIKVLHLPEARQWVRSEVPEAESGAITAPPENQDYEVNFKDGSALEGDTVGFRADRNGVYLFPVEGTHQFTYTFVPHSAMTQYRIGKRIGEVLVDEKLITEEEIGSALTAQKQQREQPLGHYLRTKAVVTAVELEKALAQQKSAPNMRLGEILLSENLITEEQLEGALQDQKKNRKLPLGELLVSQGLVTQEDIQQCLAKKLGIPFVDLTKYQIDEDTLHRIPEELINKHHILPLHIYENKLVVAVENPMVWEPLEAVRFHTSLHVEPVMASHEDLERTINHHFATGDIGDMSFDEFEGVGIEQEEEVLDDDKAVTDNVVVRLVNKIIIGAHQKDASDIHIEPYSNEGKTVVRIRKDGSLMNYYEVPAKLRSAIVARIKIMAGLDIAEKRKPQDGKIDFKKFSKLKIELRVATLPTVGGQEDVVMRILAGGEPIKVADLGLSDLNQAAILRLISKPYGLFFVCGPTGSGKTTTLHSLLGYLNTPDRKIWTAEDPVEITQKGLRQVQVLPKIGLTFAAAMRAFLRADPDIIMVGEMRDEETTGMGIEASLTGHMVFATLHTNSAPESIIRLLDMGMDPFNFADALTGILAQRLAKRLCKNCREAYTPDTQEVEELALEYCHELARDEEERKILQAGVLEDWKKRFTNDEGQFILHRSVGCEECEDSGYRGRVGIHELLEASDVIKQHILSRARVSEILHTALSEGMRTLKQDGIEKVMQGITDIHQVRQVCVK